MPLTMMVLIGVLAGQSPLAAEIPGASNGGAALGALAADDEFGSEEKCALNALQLHGAAQPAEVDDGQVAVVSTLDDVRESLLENDG